MPDTWTIVGTIVGVLSLILAAVQTVRYQATKKLLDQLQNREQIATWSLYDLAIQAYTSLGEARAALRDVSGAPVAAIEKTAQVASLLNAIWLKLIEHAATLEPEFTEATIERWRNLGRLDSDWRLQRARKLLPASISGEKAGLEQLTP